MSEGEIVEVKKVRCTVCDWKGKGSELLEAENPFEAGEVIWGCPDCRSVTNGVMLCDAPRCKQDATCGWNQEDGTRRNTCGDHMRKHHNPRAAASPTTEKNHE